jgi:hypothetical protein
MPSLNESSTNSQADNIATDYSTAKLTIYNGTPPANAATALSGNTVLVEHTLAGWGAAALGVILASAIANEVIVATGTATFARLVLTTKTMQVTAGTGAQELVLSSTSYVLGEDSVINSLRVTQPAS